MGNNKNHMEFTKCKVLLLVENNPIYWHRPGADSLVYLGILVDKDLIICPWYIYAVLKASP